MAETVLITGGAGFVGSNLALYLKASLKPKRIMCLDSLIRAGSELNVARLQNAGVDFVKGDIRDKKALLALPKTDIILECSAEPSVLAGYEDPQYTIDTNLMGTINCLEKAKQDRADFIFLSTSRVYPVEAVNGIAYEELSTRFDWRQDASGAGFSYQGINEYFTLNGTKSLYGATKCASEQIVIEYLDMFELKGVINRLGVIAGPWQMGKPDQGIVGFWMLRHKFGGALSYIGYGGGGKQLRDAIHVDDVCGLIFYQMNNLDKINGKIYNVGGGRSNAFSLQELTGKVQKITQKKITIDAVKEERRADVRIYITDNGFIRKDTGFLPKKSLDDILDDTNRWIEENLDALSRVVT